MFTGAFSVTRPDPTRLAHDDAKSFIFENSINVLRVTFLFILRNVRSCKREVGYA